MDAPVIVSGGVRFDVETIQTELTLFAFEPSSDAGRRILWMLSLLELEDEYELLDDIVRELTHIELFTGQKTLADISGEAISLRDSLAP